MSLLVCSASRRSALGASQAAALNARRTRKSMIDSSRRAPFSQSPAPRKEAGFTIAPMSRSERPAKEPHRPIISARWAGRARGEALRGDNAMWFIASSLLLQYSEKTVHRGTGRHNNYRDRGGGWVRGRWSHMGSGARLFRYAEWKQNEVEWQVARLLSRCYSIAENEYCQTRGGDACKECEKTAHMCKL